MLFVYLKHWGILVGDCYELRYKYAFRVFNFYFGLLSKKTTGMYTELLLLFLFRIILYSSNPSDCRC